MNSRAGARELGELMRTYRKKARLTLRDLGEVVDRCPSHLHRLETGERGVTSELEFTLYLSSCGVSCREIEELIEFLRDANDRRGYWMCSGNEWMPDSLRTLTFHETQARRVVNYESNFIPGLLQTEAYTRALFSDEDLTEDTLEVRVRARQNRQKVQFVEKPGKFTYVINERALRLEVGDNRIMAEQLMAILFLSDQPNINVRVLPAAAGHRAIVGSHFVYLAHDEFQPLVYVETPLSGFIIEQKEKVEQHRDLFRKIAKIALDAKESRSLIAKLADEYDRTEGHWDDSWKVAGSHL
ncbi:helix-turn-helix domain-containing protein [Actinokineospora sp. HUAS TT18]|uniref:helix-turn-helix domain-containing protein n=1 Tax=Actinokineospora sp. HUAS TT18 TaxID=3447451 RepID=UPI003F528EA0